MDARRATTATPPTRRAPGQTIRLQTDLAVGIEGDRVAGAARARAGRAASTARCRGPRSLAAPADVDDADARIDATTCASGGAGWARARIPDHRYREPIQRSALAIKGLTYMPTGATVAALTTSLPETPGGERNWDYRYSWMRDSTFTLQALHWLNLDWEADEFMQFVADLEPNDDGALQIMYGIDGRRDLTESTRRPPLRLRRRAARCGSATAPSTSARTTSSAPSLDSILLHTRRSQRLPRRLWPIVQAQAECATQRLARARPGHLGGARRAAALRLVEADVLGRARPGGQAGRDPRRPATLQATWRATAEEIRADILEHGVSDRGVLRQHYDTDALDASTLLAPIFGFLPGDDERLRASVLAIADELTENGFVLRYRTDETDDGLSGKEGTFLICSFWLGLGAGDRRRAAAGARPDGAAAAHRLAARAVRRGVRRRHRLPPRQLPAGVLPPRADRGRRADHPRRAARGAPAMS